MASSPDRVIDAGRDRRGNIGSQTLRMNRPSPPARATSEGVKVNWLDDTRDSSYRITRRLGTVRTSAAWSADRFGGPSFLIATLVKDVR